MPAASQIFEWKQLRWPERIGEEEQPLATGSWPPVLCIVCQVNEPDLIAALHVGITDLAVEVVLVHDGPGRLIDVRAIPTQCALYACAWPKTAVGDLCIKRPQQGGQEKAEGRYSRLQLFLARRWISKTSPLGVIGTHTPTGRAVKLAAVPTVPLAFLTNTDK
jgi:hypothetical protein